MVKNNNPLGDLVEVLSKHDADGVPVQEDEDAIRAMSFLPPEDEDEAFCARHQREMDSANLRVKIRNRMHRIRDGYTFYYCPECLTGMTKIVSEEMGEKLSYKEFLTVQLADHQELVERYLKPVEDNSV